MSSITGGGSFGSFIGFAFTIGSLVYGLLSPNESDKPEFSEIQINNYTRNAPVYICYGTDRYAGTCIFIGNNFLDEAGEGGKGGMLAPGSGGTASSYAYFAEFAVAFGEGEFKGVNDIFINEESIIEKYDILLFEYYNGTDDQSIDPTVFNFLDTNAIPFKNTSYLLLSGFLGQANIIPTITAEVSGLFSYQEFALNENWAEIGEDYTGVNWHKVWYYNGYAYHSFRAGDRFVTYKLSSDGIVLICDNTDEDRPVGQYINIYPTALNSTFYGIFYTEFTWCGAGWCNMPRVALINLLTGYAGTVIEATEDCTLCCHPYSWAAVYGSHIYLGGPVATWSSTLQTYNHALTIHTDPITFTNCTDLYPLGRIDRFHETGGLMTYYIYDHDTGDYQYYIASFTGSRLITQFTPPINEKPLELIRDLDYKTYMITAASDNWWKLYEVMGNYYDLKCSYRIAGPTDTKGAGVASYIISGNNIILSIQYWNLGGASPNYYYDKIFRINSSTWEYEELGESFAGATNQPLRLAYNKGKLYACSSYNYSTAPPRTIRVYYNVLGMFVGTGLDANPIDVTYDFMTNERYGMGIPTDMFDGAPHVSGSWKTEHDYCDENIDTDVNTTECRFVYSNYFDNRRKAYDIIKDVLQTCRGYLYYCDGKIKVGIQKSTETPVIYFGYDSASFLSTTIRTPSVSPSISASASISPSVSASRSISISPSVSVSRSPSVSASVSVSISPSASISYSISPSVSASASISPSVSASRSSSRSASRSASRSPSVSISRSPSVSISASPSINPEDLSRIYLDLSSYPSGYWNGDLGSVYVFTTGDSFDFVIINQIDIYIEVSDDFPYLIPSNSQVIITKDNIERGSFQFHGKNLQESANRITLTYKNREDGYVTDTIEKDNVYDIESTGEIRQYDYEMNGIKRNSQARRMLQFLCDYMDTVSYFCSFRTDILGLTLCVGSIIGVNHPLQRNNDGSNLKLCRIVSMEELEDYNVQLELVEYIPDVYHDYAVDVKISRIEVPSNKYSIPDQVERLFLFESIIDNIIYITFKQPSTNNYLWIGASLYIKESTAETWTYLGISYKDSPSVGLEDNITNTQTTIEYDPETMNLSFPFTGSFFIDEEEIYYNGIDDTNNLFLNCVRGFNSTTAISHLSGEYCISFSSDTFSFEYNVDWVGKTYTVKAISVTFMNIFADGSLSPTEDILIKGYSLLPYPVSSLKYILQ